MNPQRIVKAPTGSTLHCKTWQIEAPYRMLQNNLDPDVARDPDNLIVYGGTGRAVRNWACFDATLKALETLDEDETLLMQSGKPVGIFKTHKFAPRVLITNSLIVPHWSTWEYFRELVGQGLTVYGQISIASC